MKTYKSVKTEELAGLVEQTETHVTLVFENNTQKQFAASTFKRWWKEVPDTEFITEQEQIVEEQTVEEQPVEKETPKESSTQDSTIIKEESSKPPKRGPKTITGPHPLQAIIEEHAILAHKAVIFKGKVQGFRSMKVNNHMYMAVNFNSKGVTLQLRSKAIEHLEIEYKHLNHMFDARVTFTEVSDENINTIKKLMDASHQYQLTKQPKSNKKSVTETSN